MGLRRLLLVATLVGGCGEAEPAEPSLPELAEAQVDTVESDERATPLQRRRDYLTQWSRCLNRTSRRLVGSWARLEQDIDVDKQRVRVKGQQPYFDPLDAGLLDACPLGTQVPEAVSGELVRQGRAYVLAARGYGNRAEELRAYFDTEGYVSDDWETLRDELPALEQAWEEAHTAAESFAATLLRAQDAADAAFQEELAAAGQADSAPWHVTQVARAARATDPCATDQRPVPQTCEDVSEAFTAARDGLERWHDTHPAEAPGVFWLDVFRKRAATLEQAIAGLDAPVSRRKKTAALELEAAKTRVVEARSAVQVAANTVVFDFP